MDEFILRLKFDCELARQLSPEEVKKVQGWLESLLYANMTQSEGTLLLTEDGVMTVHG
jgi:hypothetical protein